MVSEKVFTMWFDHGKRPKNASYHYIVVPDVTETEMREMSNANHNIQILVNTPDIQGVKHSKQNISQLAFYKAGKVEISNDTAVSMGSQGMAMIKMSENKIETLSVSDPSRKLNRLTMTVSGIYHSKSDIFFTIPNKKEHNTLIVINLPQGVYAGKSVTIDM